jgi:sulfatase modifying factor 1
MRTLSKSHAARIAAGFGAFSVLLSMHCEARSQEAPAGTAQPQATAERILPKAPAPAPKTEGKRECPEGMARVERFCIDRYEDGLVDLTSGKPHPFSTRPRDFRLVAAESREGIFPQGYVSQIEAALACRNAGKRLCTRAEWLAACSASKACNNNRAPHVMSLYFGGNIKGKYWDSGQFNDPIINSTPGYLAKTGSHPLCVSASGVFDMEGNLHEWVGDVAPSGMGTFVSSCYSDRRMGCGYYAAVHARGYHDYSTGFRCCL